MEKNKIKIKNVLGPCPLALGRAPKTRDLARARVTFMTQSHARVDANDTGLGGVEAAPSWPGGRRVRTGATGSGARSSGLPRCACAHSRRLSLSCVLRHKRVPRSVLSGVLKVVRQGVIPPLGGRVGQERGWPEDLTLVTELESGGLLRPRPPLVGSVLVLGS